MGFWTLSIIRYSNKSREHNVLESGSVSVLRSPLERGPVIVVSSFYKTRQSRCLPLDLKTETDPVSETLCCLIFLEYRTIGNVKKPNNSDYNNIFLLNEHGCSLKYRKFSLERTILFRSALLILLFIESLQKHN
jgi:hypothetical protein